jgi:hypothetical protein
VKGLAIRTLLHGLDSRVNGGVAGDDHYQEGGVELSGRLQHLHPAHPRHLEVQKHHGKALRITLDGFQPFLPIGRSDDLTSVRGEDPAAAVTDDGLIIDHQDLAQITHDFVALRSPQGREENSRLETTIFLPYASGAELATSR